MMVVPLTSAMAIMFVPSDTSDCDASPSAAVRKGMATKWKSVESKLSVACDDAVSSPTTR